MSCTCKLCDVNGTLNGKKSFEKWKNYLSKKLILKNKLNIELWDQEQLQMSMQKYSLIWSQTYCYNLKE